MNDIDERRAGRPVDNQSTPEQIEQLIAAHRRGQRQRLPRWVPPVMTVLPYVLITVTILNGLIGLIAVATPYLAAWFGSAMADPIYSAYSLICPQRPSHTFFIEGHPMAFEQRDLSMHLGFGATGLLYLFVNRLRRPLPTWGLVLGVAPLLIDVAISTAGILPSTWFSRLWTGALASCVIVWWSYPRFDSYLDRVQAHAARLQPDSERAQPESGAIHGVRR